MELYFHKMLSMKCRTLLASIGNFILELGNLKSYFLLNSIEILLIILNLNFNLFLKASHIFLKKFLQNFFYLIFINFLANLCFFFVHIKLFLKRNLAVILLPLLISQVIDIDSFC